MPYTSANTFRNVQYECTKFINHRQTGHTVWSLICKLWMLHAHPKSLGLHLEVGLQLACGEGPCCRHWLFVNMSHPKDDWQIVGVNRRQMMTMISQKEDKEWLSSIKWFQEKLWYCNIYYLFINMCKTVVETFNSARISTRSRNTHCLPRAWRAKASKISKSAAGYTSHWPCYIQSQINFQLVNNLSQTE